MNPEAVKGKLLYQKFNCTACHQIYGLGGYLGPELTTCIRARGNNDSYAKALLAAGSQRMPNFNLSENEINEMIAYLKYIDATAITYPVKK